MPIQIIGLRKVVLFVSGMKSFLKKHLTYHRGVCYIIYRDYDERGQKGSEEKGLPI